GLEVDQPQTAQPPPAAALGDVGSTARIIYVLYLVAPVTGVTAVIGVVFAYINEAQASEWLKAHYRLQGPWAACSSICSS
ncbi:MAG: hypothetical protein ACJ79M_17880, partial [Myxococcales bacterium]